jgi:hypothetical protein
MSTVALKGILKYDETVKQWSWNGRWVFGDTVQSDNQNSRSHKKKIVTQPFLYKWQESSTPSEISVPSLNVRIVGQQEQDDSHIVVEREEEDDEEEETTTTTTRNVDVGEEISSSADKQGKNAEGIIPSSNKIISQKQSIPNNTEGSIDTPKEGSSTTTTTVAETETLQGDPVTSSIITTDKKQDDNNSNSSSSSALTSSLQHTDGVLAQPATGSVVVDISDTSKEKTTTAAAAKKEHDSVIFNEHQTKESKSHDSKENDTKIKDSSQRNNNKERTVSSAIEIAAAAAAVKSVSTPIPFTKTIKKEQQTDSVSALSPAVVKQPNDTITNKNADDVEKKEEEEEEEEETKKSSPVIEKSVDKIGEETTTTTINKALESSITKTDSNIVTKMITSCNTNTEKEETTVVADKKKTEQHLPSLSSSNDKKERTPSTTTISTAIVVISEEAQNKKEMTSTVAAAATTTMTIDEQESKMLQPNKFDTDTDTTYSTYHPPVTFSAIMPNFTEASTNDSNKDHHCPPSGLWSGYFENTVAKKAGRHNNKNTLPPPSQKIAETFYLFLNATPSDSDSTTSKYSNEGNNDNDDQYYEFSKRFFAFDTATQNHIPKIIIPAAPNDEPKASSSIHAEKSLPSSSSTSLPPLSTSTSTTLSNTNVRPTTAPLISLVQVRGCGKNQFGTFEIMGYLDLNTMEMEIQRQYVVTEIPAVDVSSPDTSKIRKRRSLPLSSSSDVLTEGRSSSRKRQPTWKRKSYDPEEDRRKKRPKSSPQLQQGNLTSIPLPPGTGVNPLTLTATFMENTSSALAPGEPTPPPGSISTSEGNGMASQQIVRASIQDVKTSIIGKVSKSRIALPTQSNAATSTATTNTVGVTGTKKRAVGGGSGVRVKKRPKSADSSTNPSSKSSSGSSTYIRLPPVGDPKKARWRAAHFLYYQRDDPDHLQQQQPQQQQSNGSIAGTSGNGGNITTTTNTNNKVAPPKPRYVIYEGEMVDSKRDGRGICLYNNGMLYEGEWKRNKEHGYGKLMTSDRKKIVYEGEWERGKIAGTGTYYYGSSDPIHLGSRYIGEFRENLRNGMGRYFLPDGSVYDGQWRDGSMNGLGIFTWPDGSTYDGVWKDGKRNGPGLLNNADGFRYDGQWVNNSMEGRGSAIYPNGQRYEGSFSNGRREGRGTIHFTNGAVYEGRFRDDAVDGQGTMKMSRAMVVPREDKSGDSNDADDNEVQTNKQEKQDFMIPVSFQSDMTRILTRTGFM